MPLSIGQTVNGYELLDFLESSSKRVSYRARNLHSQRIEQLQLLPDSVRHDPERSARFFRESRILTSLQHPNILTCLGVVELGGHLAIAVEAIEAVTLADRLELGPMETEEAVRSILQVLAAVEAAHAAGVLHREISAVNILITPERLVKLTGFSAAKTAADPSVTRAGTLFGSALYAAPEIFHGITALDPRIDVYAIGCVFYALVTGRPPFDQKTEYELMMAHVHQSPIPPSLLNPAVNGLLDAVILKALSKDPAARYQSAREFYHAILHPTSLADSADPLQMRNALDEPPIPSDPTAGPANVTGPLPPAVRELSLSPAVLALSAGLFFLLAALFVLVRNNA